MDTNTNEEIKVLDAPDESDLSIIQVNQLPIIAEQLEQLQSVIEKRTAVAVKCSCTEDNYKEIKKVRAALNKERAAMDTKYKEAMNVVIAPIQAVQDKYKKCVEVYKSADLQLKSKIGAVEDGIKADKRTVVEEYFKEYAQSKNIDFLTFEQLGVSVVMSASVTSLKKSVSNMVDRVACDLKMIDTQEDREEILVEYKKTLNASEAINIVKMHKAAVQEEKRKEALRREREMQQEAAAQKVDEQLAPPEVTEVTPESPKAEEDDSEKIITAAFTVHGTRAQLRALKEYLRKEGIRYE